MPENQKLYRRNQEQKYEAIWIGRDTATGAALRQGATTKGHIDRGKIRQLKKENRQRSTTNTTQTL
eukprot:6470380-Amphidinium_carterae.1